MSSAAATTPLPRAGGPRPPTELCLLGGFRLTTVDAGLVTLSRPAQRLVAYLALHPERPVHRAVVRARLWTEADTQHAAASLRSTLWRLPRIHGRPLVTCAGSHLALMPDVEVDLWRSHAIAREVADAPEECSEDRAVLSRLFGQELLPDWDEDWLVVEQEAHRQLRLHTLERLSTALGRVGDHTGAILTGLSAVAGEPLRESAHRTVIAAHLAEGNGAEALRQFQLYRRLLADELGLPPSDAIRRMVAPLLGRPLDSTG